MKKHDPLMEKLADAFADGRTLDGNFLQENNVSADECKELTMRLAAVLRGYLRMPPPLAGALLLDGIRGTEAVALGLTTDGIWKAGVWNWTHSRLDDVLDQLKNVEVNK